MDIMDKGQISTPAYRFNLFKVYISDALCLQPNLICSKLNLLQQITTTHIETTTTHIFMRSSDFPE